MWVAALNLAYFVVEFAVARRIGSVSLFADSIDFLEDTAVNGLILLALGWPPQRRATVGILLAIILLSDGAERLGRGDACSAPINRRNVRKPLSRRQQAQRRGLPDDLAYVDMTTALLHRLLLYGPVRTTSPATSAENSSHNAKGGRSPQFAGVCACCAGG